MHRRGAKENRYHAFQRCQAVALALLLGACSGRVLPPPLPTGLSTDGMAAGTSGDATLVIRIKIPKRKRRDLEDWPAYVSASTKAMTIAFTGPSRAEETFDLNVSARRLPAACRRIAHGFECREDVSLKPCPSKANCYKGSIATFDAVSCRRPGCTIPRRAHELSANQDIRFSIGSGGGVLKFTLDGIPASVVLQPSASSVLVENSPTSFTISKCVTTPQRVGVLGVDADGNDIVGAGAPTSKLKSNDAVHLAVKRTAKASNSFELVPPSALQSVTIPNAGTVVALTASVKPLRRSGMSKAVHSQVDVTFNDEVCGVFSEFSIPTASSQPVGLVAGTDGALWFAEQAGNKIGRITTNGALSEATVPTSSSNPIDVAPGPDGAMWFTECTGNKIGRITTTGTITETPVLTASSKPYGITQGPDHALWFTELTGNNIGRIVPPGGGGTVTETAVPGGGNPADIATGADGALWFTVFLGNKIGRITTAGSITNEYPIPTASSEPIVPAEGPDGAIWFSEETGNKIGRITTAGMITHEYPIPTSGSVPEGIAAGPDGAMWFVECVGNKVGRITTAGTITHEYPIPTSGSQPADIVAGPDGALWFTECIGNKIGRLQ
jgi:virginiamycin B lyase